MLANPPLSIADWIELSMRWMMPMNDDARSAIVTDDLPSATKMMSIILHTAPARTLATTTPGNEKSAQASAMNIALLVEPERPRHNIETSS